MRAWYCSLLLTSAVACCDSAIAAEADFPPGWLPIRRLDSAPVWSDFRKVDDKVHLYLPSHAPVRGVFVCYVFHSSDPRELADLWNFALVTVPWPFEFDLGVNDKRNGRFKLDLPVGDMGRLLQYLNIAAKETEHPELATVPIVGWLGQNGSHLCDDLYRRAPERVLAWSDSFPNRLRQFPELTKAVPFPFAWEISKGELQTGARAANEKEGPLDDLSCRANTYGFGHGIYSKYNFFVAYLDRCIRLRMPKETPPAGEVAKLKPIRREDGWVGDFDPIGQWNPIAKVVSAEAKAMKYPAWLPDEYAAWMWRSYHSANPDLRLTAPIIEYSKHDGKWGGPRCGLGYGGFLSAADPVTFSAESSTEYANVEFRSGDRLLGTAAERPWKLDGVRLDAGLHALFCVGVAADGHRTASRPGFVIVKE